MSRAHLLDKMLQLQGVNFLLVNAAFVHQSALPNFLHVQRRLGASTQRKNNKGETPYDLAIKAGYENIANKFTASVGQTALDKLIKPRGTATADVF